MTSVWSRERDTGDTSETWGEIFFRGFANNHRAEIVGIDQLQTRKWLKLSDAVSIDW